MRSGFDFVAMLQSLDAQTVIRAFWFLIFFEVPRYVLANTVSALAASPRVPSGPADVVRKTVSVIVPCHNGGDGVAKTVASLHEQTIKDLEIVVVDDGSVDHTASLAMQLRQQNRISVLVSTGLRGGKSAALNLGWSYCTGEIIVCVDADTTFNRDGLECIIAQFDDERIGGVSGNVGVRNAGQSLLATMQAVEYAISISVGRRVATMLGVLPIISGAFAAYRSEALQSVGGWEAGPGEDADLTTKLRRAGWELGFAANAHALTDAPVNLAALHRQRVRWESDLLRIQWRKYRSLVAPWSREFSLRGALTAIDVLLFSIAPPFAFFIYVLSLCATFGSETVPILMVAAIIYSIIGAATFLLGIEFSGRPELYRLLPYSFAYGVYSVYIMHPVRLYAFAGELIFELSHRSQFAPKKVLNRIGRS